MPYDGSWWKRGGGCCLPPSLRSLRQSSSRRRYMPHEYFGRPEAAKRKPTGRRIPCRSRLSLWEWQSFRSYPFSRDSRGSSAHPTIPPQVSCCPWTSTRGRPWRHPSLRSVSRWNRGFECRASRIAVRHVFPAAMNNGGGIWLSGCCRWKKSAGRRNKFLATFHNSFDLMLFNTRHTVMPESFILFLSR